MTSAFPEDWINSLDLKPQQPKRLERHLVAFCTPILLFNVDVSFPCGTSTNVTSRKIMKILLKGTHRVFEHFNVRRRIWLHTFFINLVKLIIVQSIYLSLPLNLSESQHARLVLNHRLETKTQMNWNSSSHSEMSFRTGTNSLFSRFCCFRAIAAPSLCFFPCSRLFSLIHAWMCSQSGETSLAGSHRVPMKVPSANWALYSFCGNVAKRLLAYTERRDFMPLNWIFPHTLVPESVTFKSTRVALLAVFD